MRSRADGLSVWQSAGQFKMASLIAMIAAFGASLDGYRKLSRRYLLGWGSTDRSARKSTSTAALSQTRVSSNKWLSNVTTIIQDKYTSACGGIETAGRLSAKLYDPTINF